MQPPDDETVEGTAVDVDDRNREEPKPRYLFPVDGDNPDEVLPLVCDLVADANGELVIGAPVVLPDQTSPEAPEPRREGERLAANYVLEAKQACKSDPPVDQSVTTGHSWEAIIRTMVERYDVSTLITQDQPQSGISSLLGLEAFDESSIPETCDTVVVSRIEHLDGVESILVPIASGPHSELAIETGLAIAREKDASLELLHVYQACDAEERDKGEELLGRGAEIADGYEPVEQTLMEAEEIPEAIIGHTEPFDITVFGAPREGLLEQFMRGTIPEEVSEDASETVLITHRGGTEKSWLDKFI